MPNDTNFVFKVHNNKAGRYLLICFVGIPLIFLLIELNVAILWVLLLLTFGPVIWGFILVNKHFKIVEEIKIFDRYLTSRIYGDIDFDAIVSVGDKNGKTVSLQLKLKSGKHISWTAYTTDADNEDVQVLGQFIGALSVVMGQLSMGSQGATQEYERTKEQLPDATQEAFALVERQDKFQKLSHDINETKKRKNRTAPIAIAASLGLALIVLFKMWDSSISRQLDKAAMRPVREAIGAHLTKEKNLKDSAQWIIDRYAQNHGPYYLLSNDRSAKLKFLPKPDAGAGLPQKNGKGHLKLIFDDGGKSKYYKKIIHHPDALQWCICLQTAHKPYLLTKHWFDSEKDIHTYLYVSMINLSKFIATPSSSPYDKTQQRDSAQLEIAKAIPLDASLSLEENINNGLQLFQPLIRKYPDSSKLYLAARKGEGRMDETLFKQAADVFKRQLAKLNVDTTRFELNQFVGSENKG